MEKNKKLTPQVGDEYILTNISYLEHLMEGNTPDSYYFPKHIKTIVQYISPSNGFILKLTEGYNDNPESLRFGKEIKKIYPEFNGDDNESYIVLYDGNEAFYE